MSENQTPHTDKFQPLSEQDFLSYGVNYYAYIRPEQRDGKQIFVIRAADGTALSATEDMNEAMVMARHNELEPSVIH